MGSPVGFSRRPVAGRVRRFPAVRRTLLQVGSPLLGREFDNALWTVVMTERFWKQRLTTRALLPLLAAGLVGWLLWGDRLSARAGSGPGRNGLVAAVHRGDFVDELLVRGELDSSNNTEVRCEVQSLNGQWFRIIDVVEEGTYVRPGDFLIQLDPAPLQTELNRQLIIVEQARAAVVRARVAFESAEMAKREYLNGEYALARKLIERNLKVAENSARRARAYLQASRTLYAQGYITQQQLEADEYALKKAESDLQFVQTSLRILDRVTKAKRMADLESYVAIGRVNYDTAEYALERHEQRLKEIEEQIEKCTIRAPVAGEVVLNHLHHYGHSHMVQPGELTMENRVLIRLPDPSRMHVRVKLREHQVSQVRSGMSVRMTLEAFPEVELRGEVIKVNEYPEPADWYSPDIKEYLALVSIETPMAGMRPGLTADLMICIDETHDVLQVASQAVLTQADGDYCIVADRGGYRSCRVTLGPNNGRTVVVEEGLREGDLVVLRPSAVLSQVAFPE